MLGQSPRIIILGAAGQLGQEFSAQLAAETLPLTHADLELTDAQAVRRKITDLMPTAVINCAAYNFVDRAEDEPEAASAVNAHAVRNLAQVCHELEATLIHFSTDYVFGMDSKRRTPYQESDTPWAINLYGASKLSGEWFVRSRPKHFLIRTSGLYGRGGSGGKGTNFAETMLRLASEGKPIKVVNDQILTPSYAADVAAGTIQLMQTGRYGLYHLTNSGECSWYEFAKEIFELSDIHADLSPTTSKEFGSRARRPAYSVLSSEHAHTPKLRPWREALAAYLRQRET